MPLRGILALRGRPAPQHAYRLGLLTGPPPRLRLGGALRVEDVLAILSGDEPCPAGPAHQGDFSDRPAGPVQAPERFVRVRVDAHDFSPRTLSSNQRRSAGV